MKHPARRCEDQFLLRLPPGWRSALKSEAKAARRSMNAEVLIALRKHLPAIDPDQPEKK